ncbi:hypothetical protein SJAV_20180 [Sulfurisphaera javensis]|uniref:SRPBCC family protein n=1 Tax=Sulfurisphaera javensis TaxID=2049879 RepID=A0AAT9GT65_9CREN
MKELQYDLECNCEVPRFIIMRYFADPVKLVESMKAIKSVKQLDDNSWELEAKWLFYKARLTLRRILKYDEVIYFIEKQDGKIKGSSYIRFIILPNRILKKYVIKSLFVYEGSLGTLVEFLAEGYYRRLEKEFEKEINNLVRQAVSS